MSKIIFFDLASKKPEWPWGPNNWRTRYTLNYKGIPYDTEWIEFPDIAPKSKALGIPPGETDHLGNPQYCVPAIWDPTTQTGISNSYEIAKYLDRAYPNTPPVIFDGIDEWYDEIVAIPRTVKSMARFVVPLMYEQVLNEASRPYFKKTREEAFGCTLDELKPQNEEERKRLWEVDVKGGFEAIDEWVSDRGKRQSTFFRGEEPCYVDFALGGYVMWFKLLFGEESEKWKDISERWNEGRIGKFFKSLEKYEKPRVSD